MRRTMSKVGQSARQLSSRTIRDNSTQRGMSINKTPFHSFLNTKLSKRDFHTIRHLSDREAHDWCFLNRTNHLIDENERHMLAQEMVASGIEHTLCEFEKGDKIFAVSSSDNDPMATYVSQKPVPQNQSPEQTRDKLALPDGNKATKETCFRAAYPQEALRSVIKPVGPEQDREEQMRLHAAVERGYSGGKENPFPNSSPDPYTGEWAPRKTGNDTNTFSIDRPGGGIQLITQKTRHYPGKNPWVFVDSYPTPKQE